MKKPSSGVSAEGRTPPPEEKRFTKGNSGNPRGRPKGAVSLKQLTRKVAFRIHRVDAEGRSQRLTLLNIIIRKAQVMAATGHVGAAALISDVRVLILPAQSERGALLLAPAELTKEEWIAQVEARNADSVEPGTEVDVETEEFLKAVRGEPSRLGEALLAFHKKYSADPVSLRPP